MFKGSALAATVNLSGQWEDEVTTSDQPNQLKSTLWTAEELRSISAASAKGHLSDSEQHTDAISGIQIDSRRVTDGDLFVPLRAPWAERDGHQFIQNALARGASAYLCADESYLSGPSVYVRDTFEGLNALARRAVERSTHATRVALTGSSGKTTLRHWLGQMLSKQGHYHASEGSFNNHLGVPLTLARMPRETRLGVFEVGTNHMGEIAPLSRLIEPQLAIVLNILPVHIGHFPNFEALVKEKLSITEGIHSGLLLCPEAFSDVVQSRSGLRILTFGASRAADFVIDFHADGQSFEIFDRTTSGATTFIGKAPIVGSTYQETAAVALIIGRLLNQPLDECISALAHASLPGGRGRVIDVAGITIIDDSYNANPVSMRAALERLVRTSANRRVAILGEMYELGDLADQAHADASAWALQADDVLLVGSQFAPHVRNSQYRYLPTVDDLDLSQFVSGLEPGDTILVKGSNGVFWKSNWVDRLIAAIEAR